MLIPMIEAPVWSVQVEEGRKPEPRIVFHGSEVRAKERFAELERMMVLGSVALVDPQGATQALFGVGAARRAK